MEGRQGPLVRHERHSRAKWPMTAEVSRGEMETEPRSVLVRAEPMVELRGVYKRYGEHEVLRGIDLTVARGEVLVIIGPSGGGKSTLLRCVNGLEPVSAGEVLIEGK